jgi:hypothetical protein
MSVGCVDDEVKNEREASGTRQYNYPIRASLATDSCG